MLFQNRIDAGQRLAKALHSYADRQNKIVLALPRGGVPVAAEVARALEAPLDVLVVRKLGVPGSEETAMGAIATGNYKYLNQNFIKRLGISSDAIDTVVQRESKELARREEKYRKGRPPLDLSDRTVILIDDGLATGATMRSAIKAVKHHQPREFVVAVPVAAPEICEEISSEVDHIICAETPRPFYAVGLWYQQFSQTTDDEVRSLLKRAEQRIPEAAGRNR